MKDFNIKEHIPSVKEVKELFPGLREVKVKYEPSVLAWNIPWNKGKKGVQIPWNKGKKGLYTHSKETLQKMSKSLKGRLSPMKGKSMSEEHKQKISNSLKGRKPKPESIAKMKLAQQNRRKNGFNI